MIRTYDRRSLPAESGFYPATRLQRILTTATQAARPSVQDADYAVDVGCSALTPVAALFVGWCALCLSCVAAIATGYGAGWFALAGVSIVAALLLEFPALRAVFR